MTASNRRAIQRADEHGLSHCLELLKSGCYTAFRRGPEKTEFGPRPRAAARSFRKHTTISAGRRTWVIAEHDTKPTFTNLSAVATKYCRRRRKETLFKRTSCAECAERSESPYV